MKEKNNVSATWILLTITWVLCLIPFPGFGIIGLTVNVAAFIMAIIVITKGETAQGVMQLCASIIITPIIYIIGLGIFGATINNITQKIDIPYYKNTQQQIYTKQKSQYRQSNRVIKETINEKDINKIIESTLRKKQKEIRKSTKYIVTTIDDGRIECKNISKNENVIIMKTKSGMLLNMDTSKITKIVKYQDINGTIKQSIWKNR